MNKTQLAKAVRLTPATISAYEKGNSTPSAELLERIAGVLRFPTEFFDMEMDEVVPIDGASFRALSRMTAAQRNMARSVGNLCVELNAWMEAEFNLPDPDVPEIDPLVATPEGAAALVRAAWGLGEAPIPHMLHLLESRGVRVFSLAPECRDVGAFSFWLRRPFVCLRTDKTAERSIFDMAHELGHLVLHREGSAPHGRDAERQANTFAGNFLMPENDVRAMNLRNPDLATLGEVKKRWRVSVAALNYRLHELGITSAWHYHELCIEVSRLGRHLEVNPLPRELSQVLPQVFATLRSEGTGRGDVARALHLDAADLDALLAGLTIGAIAGGDQGGPSDQPRPALRVVG